MTGCAAGDTSLVSPAVAHAVVFTPVMSHLPRTLRGSLLALLALACAPGHDAPSVTVHYLGHAAFLLSIAGGPTVLTDFGKSRAWGLDSPIYGFGGMRPDVITRSHDHDDHAGGTLPTGIGRLVTDGEGYEIGDLRITPIPTYERSLEAPDNTSYLFEYRGLRILHLGDCQALMLGLDEPGIRERVRQLYPDNYDLVLLPIGYVRDILDEAAEFVTLLNAHRVVPMHYWSPPDRDQFLERLEGRTDGHGRSYQTRGSPASSLTLTDVDAPFESVEVVGLTPGPFGQPHTR